MDRPRIRVDLNELVANDLVLLAKKDLVKDSDGNEVQLAPGVYVYIYDADNEHGTGECFVAEGFVELNDPEVNGAWSKPAKWCCRIKGDITARPAATRKRND